VATITTAQDRVEKLLAQILIQQMKGAAQREKAVALSLAGFSNTEIADLLQTNATTIASVLYKARTTRRKP
jgi:DNA-directed RNA polymerase specialized sigma24 family protein